jgi:hypothetical protein
VPTLYIEDDFDIRDQKISDYFSKSYVIVTLSVLAFGLFWNYVFYRVSRSEKNDREQDYLDENEDSYSIRCLCSK